MFRRVASRLSRRFSTPEGAKTAAVTGGSAAKSGSALDEGRPVSVTVEPGTDVVMGPGGPGDRLPTQWEHTVGMERLEYLATMANRPLFLTDPLDIRRFGTVDEPVAVPSVEPERIVGCTGFPKGSHEVVWMVVDERKGNYVHPATGKRPTRCVECGQAFQIARVNDDSH